MSKTSDMWVLLVQEEKRIVVQYEEELTREEAENRFNQGWIEDVVHEEFLNDEVILVIGRKEDE